MVNNGNFNSSIPVHVGDTMMIKPAGMAKSDPYVKIDGFMVFIKGCRALEAFDTMRIRITVVKENFAFAERIDKRKEETHYESQETTEEEE